MRRFLFVALTTFILTACGDPEQATNEALQDISGQWAEATRILNPHERLQAYDQVLAQLADVAEDYGETPAGSTIAAGRAVAGVTPADYQAERDRLAPRVDCYAAPTVECLRPFSNRRKGGGGAARDMNAAYQDARRLICSDGFATAESSVEAYTINRANHASQLVQLAMAAAACDRPEEIEPAISAYLAADPSQGAVRVNGLLRILNTPELATAWPSIRRELVEVLQAGNLDNNTAANAALSLAVFHARQGNKAGVKEQLGYVREQLGFNVAPNTLKEIAQALAEGGQPAAGRSYLSDATIKIEWGMILYKAAGALAHTLGLVSAPPSIPQPELSDAADIDTYFTQPDEPTASRLAESALAIEQELDNSLPDRQTAAQNVSNYSNMDSAYAVLALIQQSLGAAAKAQALVEKAAQVRNARTGSRSNAGVNYIAPYQTLIATAQGRLDEAAIHAANVVNHRTANRDYVRLIVAETARSGDAEKALTVANQLGGPGEYLDTIVQTLAAAGNIDQAVNVLNAGNVSNRQRVQLSWTLIESAMSSGNVEAGKAMAARLGVLNTPQDRMQLLALEAAQLAAAGKDGDAQAAIRAYFNLGEEWDNGGGSDLMAQNAAMLAFESGYTALGMELYQNASRKDHRPVREALRAGPADEHLPGLLMLAHDYAGRNLDDVIDVAMSGMMKR